MHPVGSKRTNPPIKLQARRVAAKPGGARRQIAEANGNRVGQAARQRILTAAERIFAEAGYGSASMARIADAAGLPKANLHYYFGTKGALYHAVLSDILEIWRSAADTITDKADPATALAAYVRAKLDLSRQRPLASKKDRADRCAASLLRHLGDDPDLRRFRRPGARRAGHA
jgi:AcrR family transcriptional regulator